MTKKSILDRVYLKSPCSSDWTLMEGSEEIRFCSQCDKHVLNLSSMTRQQAEDLVAKASGELCAKLDRDNGGKVITSDQLGRQYSFSVRLPRFTSAAVAALLGIGIVARAEVSTHSNRVVAACLAPSKQSAEERKLQGGKSTLAGTVFDINKAVIVGARVTLINEKSGQEQKVGTSEEGQYGLEGLEPGTYAIKIESPGFVSFKKVGVEFRGNEQLRIDVTLQVGTLGGLAILPETDKSRPILTVLAFPIRAIKGALRRNS